VVLVPVFGLGRGRVVEYQKKERGREALESESQGQEFRTWLTASTPEDPPGRGKLPESKQHIWKT